jgi:putative resolvase
MLSSDIEGQDGRTMKAEEPKLLRVSKAAHELGLHPFTVRKWIKQGKIHAIRIGQEARIPRSEIERLAGKADDGRVVLLYARVSGSGQTEDLATQMARLEAWAKQERAGQRIEVLSDIGSGLKATRRQLQRLLHLVIDDKVSEVVITYPDRLTRFGQEYLSLLFDYFEVTLTILDAAEEKLGEQELTDDLLSLMASFSGRLYGMRSHKQKELLACAQAVLSSP